MSRRKTLLLSAVAFAVGAFASALPARAEGRDWTGMAAPDLDVQQGLFGLAPGTSLKTLRGKVVVVKFFFTDCPTCRSSLPDYEALWRAYTPRGVQFIAVAYDDSSTIQGYMRSNGFSFPVAVDSSGATPRRWGVQTYPTNYLVGADGVVKAYNNLSAGLIERELEAAAGGSKRDKNILELGTVPAALSGVVDAAGKNDYGQVARVLRDHRDATKDEAAVLEAAARIERIVEQRWANRVERIRRRMDAGDRAGASSDLQRLISDFHDTAFVEKTRAAFPPTTLAATPVSAATPTSASR
jgi:peroxiredoxin